MMQDVADKKKEITDDDLLALITDEVNQPVTLWSLLDLQVSFPIPELALCFLLCHAVVTTLSYSPWLSCFCPGSDLQVSLPVPELALCFLICHAVVTEQQLIHLGSAAFAPASIRHLILLIFASIDFDRWQCSPDSAMECVCSCLWHSHHMQCI